jgi:Anti-sigma factor NepR
MKKARDTGQSKTVQRNVKRLHGDVHRTRHIRTKVDHQLRALYDQIVKEGTPDRFARLLEQGEHPADEEDSTC